ncbi:hypothetical protein EW146_g6895 [Bondarzewia mesenterica]|uniref:GATA-type domain-containing protein n=1 Tax=Bondarzewia mesenterica TaxID=1095465 RepID=A0A4S4LM90_9AGAM|nr:hypothetical protein EW146_g6895 [Bondarzewia mesenterica]
MASAYTSSAHHSHSTMQSDFRLPSIRDLNFQYDNNPPASGPAQPEHPGPNPNISSRHEWSRSTHPPPPPPHMLSSQHPAPPPISHEHVPRHDLSYSTAHIPSAPGSIPPGPPREDPAQKRPRSGAAVGVSPRSSHVSFHSLSSPISPPCPSPPRKRAHHAQSTRHAVTLQNPYPQHPSYASQPPPSYPVQPPPPHDQVQHHPSSFAPPPPGYPGYATHYMPQRAPPPPAPHSNPYPPPPTDHWQQHPAQQQHVPAPPHYPKMAPVMPTSVDSRSTTHARHDIKLHQQEDTLAKIQNHCNCLYDFASRYGAPVQLQSSLPHIQPSAAELAEMHHRAALVVRLVEDLRRQCLVESETSNEISNSAAALVAPTHPPPEDHRPPKRPWEDMSSDSAAVAAAAPETGATAEAQSTAEADMELIRTKRATTSGQNGGPGQPKSKYRKRSRATPPGKCHSCNIRETPEWRRGPDGARTLCNACGLHYAKLMRKRDKASGPDGKAPQIDLETLRASTRMADVNGGFASPPNNNIGGGNIGHANGNSNSNASAGGSATGPSDPPASSPKGPTQGPSQSQAQQQARAGPSSKSGPVGYGGSGMVPITNGPSASVPAPPPSSSQGENMMGAPPPPWTTSGRTYSSTSSGAEHPHHHPHQHHAPSSYLRTSRGSPQ